MSNLTTIAKTISQAAYMSKHGQDCADQYLDQVAEYGVDYWTAYDLMRAAAHCDSLAEFETVVTARIAA